MFNKAVMFFKNKRQAQKIYFGLACLFSILAFVFCCNALAVAGFYDKGSDFFDDSVSEYNDGTLQVTSHVFGNVDPVTGVVNFADQITLKNLTSDMEISFNSVSAKLNSGFEGADIKNWEVKNNESTLFSGTSETQYVPDIMLASNESKTFNVTTSLTGEGAGKFVNKTPFNFVYNYNAEKPGFTATIDTTDGFIKSGTPSDWTKTSNTTYTKKFPDSTAYSVILAEWDGATFKHSTDPESYSFGGFSPSSGTLTADTTFSAQWNAFLYQVCIWGIRQDVCGTNGSETANLTFGPATGETNACLDVDGHHEHCIHNDSWETIIANCNAGHADWYQSCMDNGCTKGVPINLNSDIGSNPTGKELCSILQQTSYSGHLLSKYVKWNDSYSTSDCESANWATSRIRATLNGKENQTLSSYAGTDCLSTTNCLLSCFPPALANAIKPKYYTVPTTWTTSGTYPIGNTATVSDKLWLMSGEEVYGQTGVPSYFKEFEKAQYTKKQNEGTTWNSYSKNKAYVWSTSGGSSEYWWLRSPSRSNRYNAGGVYGSGTWVNGLVNNAGYGLSPCFCL